MCSVDTPICAANDELSYLFRGSRQVEAPSDQKLCEKPLFFRSPRTIVQRGVTLTLHLVQKIGQVTVTKAERPLFHIGRWVSTFYELGYLVHA
jgi:hypothetical protein